MSKHRSDETILATVGVDADAGFGAVMPPIYLSSNYSFAGYDKKRRFDYGRSGNPTRNLLGEALAELEHGAGAVITSSGMAAIDLILNLLPPGALCVAQHDCYGGTWRLLKAHERKGALRLILADFNDHAALDAALAQRPALVWIETPSNPIMRITDIASVATRSKAAGALVAVDNTFLSPLLQKPIPLGADFVAHSTTKYLNGHSDVVGGAVVAAAPERFDELSWWANCRGVTASPFDSWLTLRGLRTLSVRLERQQRTAGDIAEALAAHSAVNAVHYPGLVSHPGHTLAARQQRGFGAMLSFEIKDAAAAPRIVEQIKGFTLAESLGGVESLIAHPATMTHAAMSPEARAEAGISDALFRLSIGLEAAGDLVTALIAALPAK